MLKHLFSRRTLGVALSLFFSASLLAAGAQVHPDSSKWTPLFKEDLSDAKFPEGVWTIESGEMTASKDESIWTQKDYENFILDLEFKTDHATNSGVIIYATDTQNWIPNSVEIQITDDFAKQWAEAPPTWRAGAVFGHLAPKKSNVKKPGEWNRMTITAKGRDLTIALNGEIVNQMDMRLWTDGKKNPDGSDIPAWLPRPFAEIETKGKIGLQGKHGDSLVWFRNVRVKELGECCEACEACKKEEKACEDCEKCKEKQDCEQCEEGKKE